MRCGDGAGQHLGERPDGVVRYRENDDARFGHPAGRLAGRADVKGQGLGNGPLAAAVEQDAVVGVGERQRQPDPGPAGPDDADDRGRTAHLVPGGGRQRGSERQQILRRLGAPRERERLLHLVVVRDAPP